MAPEFANNRQVVMAARRNMTDAAWDYLVGGSESETTLRRNRMGFDRWAFSPRVLRDVSKIDTSTSLFGYPMRIPVLLGPIGSLEMFDPDGAAASARAAEEYGTIQAVSMHSQPSTDAIAAASNGPKIFQLYPQGDLAWARDKLQAAKAAGYIALAVTTEVPVNARRERGMNSPTVARRTTGRDMGDRVARAAMNWSTLDGMRQFWDGPVMIKGIQNPADAAIAVEHNVDFVWISNHGGRQLDHAIGTMDRLPEIVSAVDGKAGVVVDGGVQRGSDVLKAIALGAKAVSIGKLQGWGLGAAGKDGLVRVLQILEAEIRIDMGLLGVTCLDELDATYLCRMEPLQPVNDFSTQVGSDLESWAVEHNPDAIA